MNDNEEQLVMRRRLGSLELEQLGQGQVGAIAEPPALLAEAGAGTTGRRKSCGR
jgi:hypothetical protein